MSRLSIEISSEEHQHIKALAALEGKSIKTFVFERLLDNKNKVSVDDKNLDWEELKSLQRYRIAQAENEEASTKSLEQIAEKILQRYNASNALLQSFCIGRIRFGEHSGIHIQELR